MSPIWGKNSEPSDNDFDEEEGSTKKEPKSKLSTTQTKINPTMQQTLKKDQLEPASEKEQSEKITKPALKQRAKSQMRTRNPALDLSEQRGP